MKFIADFHIHSYLSRATARNLNLENLFLWAQKKGIAVIGTGDFTHPQWLSELSEKLAPDGTGLYTLKSEYAAETAPQVPSPCKAEVHYILSAEISTIYKKDGKTRKVHHVIIVPSLEQAGRLGEKLARIGNIASDGRPILGLDSKILLEIVLETSPEAIFIPAHIWTPWFSVLGSKSGFDSLDACFEDLTDEIFAVETGLSSDPAMNWRVSSLDRFTLVSNSDAHSPANLGREANLFDTELSYTAIRTALKTGDPRRFLGTLEYFAEEGKYHVDGHRKCGVRMTPGETRQHQGRCPVCGRPLTIGVMSRVVDLADRQIGEKPERAADYVSLLPLTDVLSEVLQVGPKTKTVDRAYRTLLEKIGPEFQILRHTPLDALKRHGPALFSEAIDRMRDGRVKIYPGFDGEFGTIALFTESERARLLGQKRLFAVSRTAETGKKDHQGFLFDDMTTGQQETVGENRKVGKKGGRDGQKDDLHPRAAEPPLCRLRPLPGTDRCHSAEQRPASEGKEGLNPDQEAAVKHVGGPLIIVAGPGTGKTRTLTHRIAYLIRQRIAKPDQILAVTFTNKAAGEMVKRLEALLADKPLSRRLTVRTFHGLCLDILRRESGGNGRGFSRIVLGETDRMECVKKAMHLVLGSSKGAGKILDAISLAKQRLLGPDDDLNPVLDSLGSAGPSKSRRRFSALYRSYEDTLLQNNACDFDDLILKVVAQFAHSDALCQKYRRRFPYISVDEYQDINWAQYQLIRLLASPSHDLCVIGDPDQAIYGFRGADVRYFAGFQKDFPDAKRICLRQNYRSTETILKASSQILPVKDKDKAYREKGLWSGIRGASRLTIAELPTDKAEAEYVVQTIDRQVGGVSHFSLDSDRVRPLSGDHERGFSEFAVLYRTRDQARILESAFARSGIPYQSQGDRRMEDLPGISILLSYLKVIWRCAWQLDVERILESSTVGLGRRDGAALHAWAQEKEGRWLELIHGHDDIPGLHKGGAAFLAELRSTIVRARQLLIAWDVSDQLEWIRDHFALDASVSDKETFGKQMETVRHMARPFGREVKRFLTQLSLDREQDRYDMNADKVVLMTMHASKGLEFPVVFIVGCEDGLVPYKKNNAPCDVEEEGRLFYVSLTRAKERLFLTHVKKRRRFGKTLSQRISPFADIIEKELKESIRPYKKQSFSPKVPIQPSLF